MSQDDGNDAVTKEDGRDAARKLARVMPVRFHSPWPGLAVSLALMAWVIGYGHAAFWAWAVFALSVGLFTRLTRSRFFPEREVTASADSVRIGNKVIPKKEIKAAVPMHQKDRMFVRLSRSMNRSTDLQVSSEEEAETLLRELGLSAESSTMSFAVRSAAPSRKVLRMLPFALFAFLWMGGSSFLHGNLFPLGAIAIALGFFAMNRLEQVTLVVGTDGIQLNQPTKSVFYKHSVIASVEVDGATLKLHLRGGEELSFTTSREKKPKDQETELARRIRDRIMAARLAAESGTSEASSTASLDRGGRSAHEWLEFLRRVGEGAEASFRKAAISRATLLATLENPAARSLDRLAAAVSLARNLTPEEEPRVRVAIDACAEQKLATRLRVALSEPSEEVLERALVEAEAEADVSAPGVPRKGSRSAL